MSSLDDLILTLTSRIIHEQDFAFRKNKEEWANRIRSDCLPMVRTTISSSLAAVSIDDEGDVRIDSDRGVFFLTDSSVIVGGWLTTIGALSDAGEIRRISQVIEELFKARAPLSPTSYDLRLFFSFRFKEPTAMNLLLSNYFAAAAPKILGDTTTSQLQNLRFSAGSVRSPFEDNLELDGTLSEFRVRYLRESKSEGFKSYSEFLSSASPAEIAGNLRHYLEIFVADPSKLRGRIFREKS